MDLSFFTTMTYGLQGNPLQGARVKKTQGLNDDAGVALELQNDKSFPQNLNTETTFHPPLKYLHFPVLFTKQNVRMVTF